jgi:triacylglycerol lipase
MTTTICRILGPQRQYLRGDTMDEVKQAITTYDPNKALLLGTAAALAYKDLASVEQTFEGWSITPLSAATTDTAGFVAGNAEMIVISFRGTEPDKLKDWLTDLNAIPVDGPVGKVHEGFNAAVSSVWTDLVAALGRLRDNGQTIWITGHSLGAALAHLAAARLLKENVVAIIDGLYTFGQPRTGDSDFAVWSDGALKTRMFRFVNNNDIVPHVPLPPLYKHAGTFLHFDRNGTVQSDVGYWESLKKLLTDKIRSLFDDKLVPAEIEDHFMANYLAQLQANLEGKPS